MDGADRRDRWKSAAGAAGLVCAIGYGLIAGLNVRLSQTLAEDLKVMAVLPDAPLPKRDPVPAIKPAQQRRQGAASPPSLTAHATEIVAPPLVIPPPAPVPVVVAEVAGRGNEASQGAAPVVGPGTGSGGQGNGTGSGSRGDGDGGRGGGEIPLRLIHGKLRYRDLPRDLLDMDAHGTVGMHFIVDATGRVSECRVTATSGNPTLDAATCALTKAKLRYRPTRDAQGRPRADYVDGQQEWTSIRRAEDDPAE